MTCYKNIVYGPDFTVDVNGVVTGSNTANVIIPATGKSKLNIVPVLAEDNVQVAYYRYTLTFESLIYSANAVLTDIELEIRRIETILSTPGLKLSIFPVGLGYLPVVNSTGFPDLTGGPFPEDISVTPIASNEGIIVSGTFRFDISHCSPYIDKQLVQYTSGIEYQIDEEGNISFTVDTTYQARSPITNKDVVKNMGAEISKNVGKVFVGFKRKTKLSFSRDQRIARIKTELSEIRSDAAFAPYTKHIDFDDEIDGSLWGGEGLFDTGGFYKWQRSMSCTITLPQRTNKIWAWYVFRQLFVHRLKGIKSYNKANAEPDIVPTTNQVAEAATNAKKKAWYLLTHFRIKNPLFSRSITFELQYLMTMPLNDILANKCNIFTTVRHNIAPEFDDLDPPAEIPGSDLQIYDPNTTDNRDLTDEWDYWTRVESKLLTGMHDYVTSGPIVYAQCALSPSDPIPSKLSIGASVNKYGEQEPLPDSGTKNVKELTGVYNEPQKSWLKYDNDTQIIQTNNNEQVDYIQNTPLDNYQSAESQAPVAASQGFQINHETSGEADSFVLPETVVFGTATNKIRMKGHAVRVGHKIPCPALVSYNNSPVERIGTSRFSHKVIGTSSMLVIDPNDPEDPPVLVPIPIYLAMWDVTYAVNSNIRHTDILAKIKSSGSPAIYS